MPILEVMIINDSGSLMFDWPRVRDVAPNVEKTFSYPIDLILEQVNSRLVVVFGERDGIYVGWSVSAVNGCPVGNFYELAKTGGLGFEKDAVKYPLPAYFVDESNFPMDITFSPPQVESNQMIMWASTFHSIFTIAVQLSPVPNSSGIQVLDTSQFRLHCFQSRTGVKFILITTPESLIDAGSIINRLYELYADYALKNPFYPTGNPIRLKKFEDEVQLIFDRHNKAKANALTV